MSRNIALSVLFAAAVVVFLTTSVGATDNPKFLVATGKEYIWPIQLGTVKCAGGTPTGSYPQCSQDTNTTVMRGEIDAGQLADVTGPAAPMFQNAVNSYVVNCNLDKNLKGPCWGTFVMEVPGQGKWEGTLNGVFDLMNYTASYSGVGHGSGGPLDGLQMKYEAVWNALPYANFSVRVDSK